MVTNKLLHNIANYLRNHNELYNNLIIKGFLNNKGNHKAFEDFIKSPTIENYEILDTHFKRFYLEIRLISYLAKSIYYNSINYDKKNRRYHSRNLLMIDNNETANNPIDQINVYIPDLTELILSDTNHLLDHISDPNLYKILSRLTVKQLNILELYCIKRFNATEIAKMLNVSAQFIYKTLNVIRMKVKKHYEEVG